MPVTTVYLYTQNAANKEINHIIPNRYLRLVGNRPTIKPPPYGRFNRTGAYNTLCSGVALLAAIAIFAFFNPASKPFDLFSTTGAGDDCAISNLALRVFDLSLFAALSAAILFFSYATRKDHKGLFAYFAFDHNLAVSSAGCYGLCFKGARLGAIEMLPRSLHVGLKGVAANLAYSNFRKIVFIVFVLAFFGTKGGSASPIHENQIGPAAFLANKLYPFVPLVTILTLFGAISLPVGIARFYGHFFAAIATWYYDFWLATPNPRTLVGTVFLLFFGQFLVADETGFHLPPKEKPAGLSLVVV